MTPGLDSLEGVSDGALVVYRLIKLCPVLSVARIETGQRFALQLGKRGLVSCIIISKGRLIRGRCNFWWLAERVMHVVCIVRFPVAFLNRLPRLFR